MRTNTTYWVSTLHAQLHLALLRVDEKTKQSAKKVFESLGLDMSSAVKLYLHQVIINKGIPFPLLTENGLTPQQEDEILKAEEEARRGVNVTKAMNPDEAIEFLKRIANEDEDEDFSIPY